MYSRHLLGAGMPLSRLAFAHGFAGDHMFTITLPIDDPNVADEASGDPDARIAETFGFEIDSFWLTQSLARARLVFS